MSDLKSFFSSKTRHGRAVRTFLQTLFGVLTFVVGLLTLPGFEQALAEGGVVLQAGTLAAWVGIISYLQNALEGLLEYLGE